MTVIPGLPSSVVSAGSRVTYAQVAADGKTVTDGVITGNQLSSTAAAFTTADAGKLCVVVGAGATAPTGTTSGSFSGNAQTSIPVSALAAAIPAGPIWITDGSKRQTFITAGAAQSATSIPITSANVSGTYALGSTVNTPQASLHTTIQSVSGGVATLAASAGTNIAANAEVFYATDDTVAAQAAITTAGLVGGTADFPTGSIGLSAALTSSATLTIRGQGVEDLFGSASQGFNAFGNVPTVPYLAGTVFVQCTPATDALQLSAVGKAQHLEKFGVRFAAKFVNTGHGISTANLPVYSGRLDSGPMTCRWGNISVFGHDGNHYGFECWNMMYPRVDDLHAYGGGGWHFAQNSTPTYYGNATISRLFCFVAVGGSAHAFYLDNQGATQIDYCQYLHPQAWIADTTLGSGGVAIPGVPPAQYAQFQVQTNGAHNHIGFVGPDMETNLPLGSSVNRPSGRGCYWIGGDMSGGGAIQNTKLPGGNVTGFAGPPTTGTVYQNNYGTEQLAKHQFSLQPAAAASASTTLSGSTAFKATVLPVVSGTGFSAGQGVQIDTGSTIEFRVIQSVSGNNITLTTPCALAHASGVAVLAGAAVIIAQVNFSTLTGSQSSILINDQIAAPIGDTQGRVGQVSFLVPSGWFMRIDWANAVIINGINTDTTL